MNPTETDLLITVLQRIRSEHQLGLLVETMAAVSGEDQPAEG